jgi:uncharacterized damage-inducible protein DinB
LFSGANTDVVAGTLTVGSDTLNVILDLESVDSAGRPTGHATPLVNAIPYVRRGDTLLVADSGSLGDGLGGLTSGAFPIGKIVGSSVQLDPRQFTQSVAGSYGSVRNTLVHIMSAEWGWLDRCGGPPRGERLNADDYPTFESVRETWRRVEGYMRGFLETLTDADLSRAITFSLGSGPAHTVLMADFLTHSITHAAHHRGQAALLVRALGYAPGNFDYMLYAVERAEAAAPA